MLKNQNTYINQALYVKKCYLANVCLRLITALTQPMVFLVRFIWTIFFFNEECPIRIEIGGLCTFVFD